MKISEAYPSPFLKSQDLGGKAVKVKIADVTSEIVGEGNKPVMYFEGKEKGLVLNKINATTIAGSFGDDTVAWCGKEIIVYGAQTEFQGRMVPCIRLRLPDGVPAQERGGASDDEVPF